MITIEQVQTEIAAIKKDIETSKALLTDTEKRLSIVTARSSRIKPEYEALRSQRQTALANGKEVSALNTNIKALTEEIELVDDEIAGLTARLANQKSDVEELKDKLAVAEVKIPQIKSVELAKQYNQLAAQLAKVVIDLNSILDAQPQDNHVVFYKADWPEKVGAMRRIEKLLFSDDALTLDEHSRKCLSSPRAQAHSHLVEEQWKVLYYDYALYQNEKLQAKQANREPVNVFAKS